MTFFEEGSGFSAFALYNALRLHFTSPSYDFFKYHGKTNVSKSTFATRKDKYTFYKLSRKYKLDDLQNFYVANFLVKSVNWVGDIAGEEGESNYREWQKRNQRLTYQFEQDIIHVLELVDKPQELLTVNDGQYPVLLDVAMKNEISIETLIIMNDVMGFFPMWNKKISDTVIWPQFENRCLKYAPFLNYDKDKFKNIMKESLRGYAH